MYYLGTQQVAAAFTHIQASLELSQQLGSVAEEGLSRRVLGHIYWALGELARAETALQHSLRILMDLNSKFYVAKTRLSLAQLYFATQHPDMARRYLQQAHAILVPFGATLDLVEAKALAEANGVRLE
jgi:tetratricopeptide (TPR) repeat protein